MSAVRALFLLLGIGSASLACGDVRHGEGSDADDDGGAQGDDGDDTNGGGGADDFSIAVATGRVFVRQGETAALGVTIAREDGFEGVVTVELRDLPAGVTVEPATVPAGETAATVTISAAADATQGAVDVEAAGVAGDVARSASLRLVVAGEPGTLDQSFAGGGIFTFRIGEMASKGRGLALQPDGKILVTGEVGPQAVTIRLNADGTLDDSFASGGAVSTGVGSLSRGASVTITPEGRILVGADVNVASGANVALFAYTPEGELDRAFGSGGTAVIDTGVGVDDLRQVLQLESGDLLTVARAALGLDVTVQVTRHTAAGALDTAFAINQGLYAAGSALLDGEGRLAVAGLKDAAETLSFVERFLPDGSPDQTFGGDGLVETDLATGAFDAATGLLELAGGKVFLTGYVVKDTELLLAMARYNSNGSLDLTFGDGGVLVTDTAFTPDASCLDDTGEEQAVLVAGRDATSFQPAVVRLHADGSLDESFGAGGVAVVDPGLAVTGQNAAHGVAIDGDGRIVVSGDVGAIDQASFVVARLWP
jgi:uncharacterized delta-60 repeat protein